MDSTIANSGGWLSSTPILISFITVIGTVIVAGISSYLTYHFTRKMGLEAEWRKDKLAHYTRLIEAITETMSRPKKFEEVCKQYAYTYNAISLMAPQEVANILFDFYYDQQESFEVEMQPEEEEEHVGIQRERLKQLVLAMRKDLRIKPKDDPTTFRYRLRAPLLPID